MGEASSARQRTPAQNRGVHLFCHLLADTLNAAGLDQRTVLKPSIEIPWDARSVKNRLWREIQQALLGKISTTELTTNEVTRVYDVLMRHLSEKFGVFIDFPSEEHINLKHEDKHEEELQDLPEKPPYKLY